MINLALRYQMIEELKKLIGVKVKKTSKGDNSPKPFKSTFQINTIKNVIEHPQLGIPAFTFEEDDNYVECGRCVLLLDDENIDKKTVELFNRKFGE